MDTTLWRRIKRYVITGKETPKVDLKQTLDLSGKVERAEFAKDITAIANTPGGDGFIIIGVEDAKDRTSQELKDVVPGFQAENGTDAFHIQMINALTQFCNRVPSIEYDEITPPGLSCNIGVVKIERSTKRPHSLIRASGSIEQHNIFIRRGTATYPASVEEIEEMMGKVVALPPYIVINLSGHPLTPEQQEQILKEVYIEELIELPAHFSSKYPLKGQIEEILDQISLTVDEWQSKSILLALPGLAPTAAALLAYIHGLRGGFPKVLWLERIPDSSQFTVAQLIDLQGIRDQAREIRVGGGGA
jgi:hypothetical protein